MEDNIDDIIRPWFQGFVKSDHDAVNLIAEAGKLDLVH
jgi:hypothetical protein